MKKMLTYDPAHQALRHVADALEMLEQGNMPANDWEKATMRNQVALTARKATAGVHSMTDDPGAGIV